MMWRTGKYLLLLFFAVVFFFWKIFFTAQYSISADWEAANQGYAWHQFAVSSLQKGVLPLWDPYAESGRSHVGEMQPGIFYPLKLILYLFPLSDSGILSPRLFNQYHVLARFLAACFLFFLVLELGASRFAAFIAGLCFGTGGFVGNVGGLQLLDSAIWLPLVLLFLIRALLVGKGLAGLFYGCLSGLFLSMTFLAGSIHLPIMDAIVVVTAAIFFAIRGRDEATPAASRPRDWIWTAGLILIIGLVAFAAAGVQLLPSIEYSPLAYRWGSGGETFHKISYADLTKECYFPPQSIFALVFGGIVPRGTESGTNPYMGILPLLLAIIGGYVYWHKPWVKYLSGLAAAAFFFGMGPNSLLHGVLYLAPILDMAREADRFIYLTHFAMALLAGFGAEALFAAGSRLEAFLPRFLRVLAAAVSLLAAALGIQAIFGKPEISEWHFLSFFFVLASFGLLAYVMRGNRAGASQLLLAALIACDLYGFNWSAPDLARLKLEGKDYQQQLLDSGELAAFFHSQENLGRLFRVHIAAEHPEFVNLGDMFAVQTTVGQAATSLVHYMPMTWSSQGLDVLNVRYIAAAGKEAKGKVVFEKGKWKVYETGTELPRAWIVSRTVVEPSAEQARFRIEAPDFDPRRIALVAEPLEQALSGKEEVVHQITFTGYRADLLEMDVRADDTGLLVLSETYYPGWRAEVNGKPAKIYRADSILRGVVVPPGQSRVVFRYRPRSVLYGATLSASAILAVLALGIAVFLRRPSIGVN